MKLFKSLVNQFPIRITLNHPSAALCQDEGVFWTAKEGNTSISAVVDGGGGPVLVRGNKAKWEDGFITIDTENVFYSQN